MKFQMPTRVVFGSGAVDDVKQIVDSEFQGQKIFLVTDKGVREAGLAQKVISHFPEAPVFDAVEQNPKHSTVDRAGRMVQDYDPGLIIGIGGGSVLDAAKAVALLATNPGAIEDYEGDVLESFRAALRDALAIKQK